MLWGPDHASIGTDTLFYCCLLSLHFLALEAMIFQVLCISALFGQVIPLLRNTEARPPLIICGVD